VGMGRSQGGQTVINWFKTPTLKLQCPAGESNGFVWVWAQYNADRLLKTGSKPPLYSCSALQVKVMDLCGHGQVTRRTDY